MSLQQMMYVGNFTGTNFRYTTVNSGDNDNAIPGNKLYNIRVTDMTLPVSTTPSDLNSYYTLQDRGVIQYMHDHYLT